MQASAIKKIIKDIFVKRGMCLIRCHALISKIAGHYGLSGYYASN